MSWLGKLTPEQEEWIPVYEEQWEQIAFLTEPIERSRAVNAVKAAYIGFTKLNLRFYLLIVPMLLCS
jgi:hypothetical protein